MSKENGITIDANTKIPLFTAILTTCAILGFALPLIAAYTFVQNDHRKILKHDRILLALVYSQVRLENHFGTLPKKNPFEQFLKEDEDEK